VTNTLAYNSETAFPTLYFLCNVPKSSIS